MIENISQLIAKYSRCGILIDTNILLLLFVGNVDPTRISKFKRTAHFLQEDYLLLKGLLSRFTKIVSTPNILSEVSNLSQQLGDPVKTEYFIQFAREIEVIDELYVASKNAALTDEFIKFGLADSVIIQLSNGPFLILTDDFKLSNYLASNDVDVINFNHIRVAAWD
jgi:rRNA-processing protein FCF1